MASPGQPGRSRTTLVVLALLTITIITLDFQDFGPLNSGQSAVRDGLAPATDTSDSVFSPITNAWKSLTEFDDIERENEELRAELDKLRGDVIRGQAAIETLDNVLSELDIDILSSVDTTIARVADPAGNFDNFTVDIDKGSSDGIRDGMPVVTSAGLVGKVVSVDRDRSQVALLTDAGFGIGVRIIGPGDIALASGVGRGRDLQVTEGVEEDSTIEEGMLAVTSGISGSPFPPDIPVGVVVDVKVDASALKQELRIRPIADLDQLSFVTVILWSVGDEPGDQ